jgi:hypothetical protein
MPMPRARAANAKDFLEFLERFQPGTRAHLRQVLPGEVMEAVEGSARTDWNPIDLDQQYVEAIVRWLRPERARDAWRQFTSERFVRAPAVRSLVEGAVRVFGLSVRSFVRIVPLAFSQGFRDFGTVELQLRDHDADVIISGIAPEVRAFDAYAVLFHGLFLGVYDVAKTPPRLEYRASREERRITARFAW